MRIIIIFLMSLFFAEDMHAESIFDGKAISLQTTQEFVVSESSDVRFYSRKLPGEAQLKYDILDTAYLGRITLQDKHHAQVAIQLIAKQIEQALGQQFGRVFNSSTSKALPSRLLLMPSAHGTISLTLSPANEEKSFFVLLSIAGLK